MVIAPNTCYSCFNLIRGLPTRSSWHADLGDVPVCHVCYVSNLDDNDMNKHTKEYLLAMNNNIFLWNAIISSGSLSFTLKATQILIDNKQLQFPKWFNFKKVEIKPVESEVVRLHKEAQSVS